jgi:hypothetical protein
MAHANIPNIAVEEAREFMRRALEVGEVIDKFLDKTTFLENFRRGKV